jgi:predicted peptidase
MQKTFETKEGYQYLLYLPENYLISGKKWPLILYLHGLSEAGSDLKMLKTRGLPKVLDKGVNVPFVVVSPQCPAGEYWLPETLITLLERVVGEHHIDEDRIYLTGISLGGYGVWRTAIDNPGTFAAIAPICSGGIPEGACLIKDLPAWVLHASEDTGVPVNAEKVHQKDKTGRQRTKIPRSAGLMTHGSTRLTMTGFRNDIVTLSGVLNEVEGHQAFVAPMHARSLTVLENLGLRYSRSRHSMPLLKKGILRLDRNPTFFASAGVPVKIYPR